MSHFSTKFVVWTQIFVRKNVFDSSKASKLICFYKGTRVWIVKFEKLSGSASIHHHDWKHKIKRKNARRLLKKTRKTWFYKNFLNCFLCWFRFFSLVLREKKPSFVRKRSSAFGLWREDVLNLLRRSAESLLDSLRKSPIGENLRNLRRRSSEFTWKSWICRRDLFHSLRLFDGDVYALKKSLEIIISEPTSVMMNVFEKRWKLVFFMGIDEEGVRSDWWGLWRCFAWIEHAMEMLFRIDFGWFEGFRILMGSLFF